MIVRTTCQYDCTDGCGLLAEVTDHRITAVRGDREHPYTKGILCGKLQHYEEMLYHPERILYPLKRTGEKGKGEFQRITWDEAVRIITDRWKEIIRTTGPEAILPYSYAGTEGILQKNCGEAFFHYMGASKLKRTICSSAKGAGYKAVMGKTLAMPPYLLSESDRILIWGSNIAATRLHEIPLILAAKKKGAKVTLIDVYASAAAPYCDDVIAVKPSTDGALALAMIHVMEKAGLTDRAFLGKYTEGYDRLLPELEAYTPEWAETITGVPAETIRALAVSFGKAERPAILLGSGPSRHPHGAMAVRCITALPAVTGSWKNGFGLCGTSQSGPWGDMNRITRPDFDKNHARTINMMQLASALDPEKTDPPVKSLYVYCSNPAAVTAAQKQVMEGLERESLFTVVHERFMTDTAKFADIILPAVFTLEAYDIFQPYGYNAIQYAKKAADAPGECRSNWDTFCLLAKGMGFTDPYFSMTEEEKCLSYLDHKTGQQGALTPEEWDRLMAGSVVEKRYPGMPEIRTETGKIMLYDAALAEPMLCFRDEADEEKYPLRLVAAPSIYTLNSTFTTQETLVRRRGAMSLKISGKDAEVRGIRNGDEVICENELAAVRFAAVVDPSLLPGTVVAEGVYRRDQAPEGLTVNALFSERLSDMGEATTMNGNRVQIRKTEKQGL